MLQMSSRCTCSSWTEETKFCRILLEKSIYQISLIIRVSLLILQIIFLYHGMIAFSGALCRGEILERQKRGVAVYCLFWIVLRWLTTLLCRWAHAQLPFLLLRFGTVWTLDPNPIPFLLDGSFEISGLHQFLPLNPVSSQMHQAWMGK